MATEPRTWLFPRDHGPHEDHWIEWWYYTGNVSGKNGQRFGYQLTFFRTGIDRQPNSSSSWAVRDLYVAHFAISDVRNKRILSFEKTNRSGIGWAGAELQVPTQVSPDQPSGGQPAVRIWNAGWEVQISHDGDRHRLKASSDDASIDLLLTASRPLTYHHGDGLSQKGPSVGNASHYYSYTSMKTSGDLEVDGRSFKVTGQSWMDHEFSSSFLEQGQVGWDWMSLQLTDDIQLMLYQIRRDDGSASPHSSGTILFADGRQVSLEVGDIKMTPIRFWKSKRSGGRYPIQWQVAIAKAKLDLTVKATFGAQEMDTSASTGIIYWEGCVDVVGMRDETPLTGQGYLEMTGYAK
jgi:predicted secreted hydrolase